MDDFQYALYKEQIKTIKSAKAAKDTIIQRIWKAVEGDPFTNKKYENLYLEYLLITELESKFNLALPNYLLFHLNNIKKIHEQV